MGNSSQVTLGDCPDRRWNAVCNRRHTPAFCQSLRRLQHVTPLPKPKPFGSIPKGCRS